MGYPGPAGLQGPKGDPGESVRGEQGKKLQTKSNKTIDKFLLKVHLVRWTDLDFQVHVVKWVFVVHL